MAQPIRPDTFRDLVSGGAVRSASIIGQKGGFAVVATVGMETRPLGTRTGAVRMFSTVDTAAKLLRSMGVAQALLDMSNYQEGTLRPGRPDRAQNNRAAHAALEHDRWFREQVRGTLKAVEDGSMPLIDSDTMWAELTAEAKRMDAARRVSK